MSNDNGYLPAKPGLSILIKRKDGTTFFCASGTGDKPAIWAKRNRKYAVEHKKDLQRNGFNCKIVPVLYSEPVIDM